MGRYTVRNENGELHFANYLEMEQAWLAGLVDPEDEVREDGKDSWIRAREHTFLIKARPPPRTKVLGGLMPWLVASLVTAAGALYAMLRGSWTLGLPLALILSALLSVVTYKAYRREALNWRSQASDGARNREGQRYNVRVTQDLTENFSVEVYPVPDPSQEKRSEPFKTWPVPLCLKLRADSKEDALLYGLEHMKKLGKIDDFHLEPNERPAPPAAAAKPKADAEEEA